MSKRLLAETLPETLFAHILNRMIKEDFKKILEVPCELGTTTPNGPAMKLRHQFYTWRRRINENPENYPDHFVLNVNRIRISAPAKRGEEYILTFSDVSARERSILDKLADRLGLNDNGEAA